MISRIVLREEATNSSYMNDDYELTPR
jgi:hypothetical protein